MLKTCLRAALVSMPLALLVACGGNPGAAPLATTVSNDQAVVEAGLDSGCAAVSAATALAQPFINNNAVAVLLGIANGTCVGGKATAALIDKALADPTTQAWENALPGQITSAVNAIKSL